MSHQVHDALDVGDVTGNLDFEGYAQPGVGLKAGGRCHDGGVSRGRGRTRDRMEPGNDEARPVLPDGPRNGCSEAGQRAVASIRDLEERIELGELEQRLEIVVQVGEAELATLLADLLGE